MGLISLKHQLKVKILILSNYTQLFLLIILVVCNLLLCFLSIKISAGRTDGGISISTYHSRKLALDFFSPGDIKVGPDDVQEFVNQYFRTRIDNPNSVSPFKPSVEIQLIQYKPEKNICNVNCTVKNSKECIASVYNPECSTYK
jgi:hypothetical protein